MVIYLSALFPKKMLQRDNHFFEFEDFFAIFAKNDCNLLRKLYPTHIRPFMSQLGTDFWDGYVKKN